MAYPETDSIRWLKQNVGHERVTSLATHGLDWMPANAAMVFGLRDIHGSDSLRVRTSFDLVSPPGKGQDEYPGPNSPLMDELGVRYLMTRKELSGKWVLARDSGMSVYENPFARPRAYLSPSLPALEPKDTPPATFLRDSPDAITLSLIAPAAGALILNDSYYPGWRAWVDGKPAPITPYRDAFRSVSVPAGTHTIEMRYQPATFRVGLFISLIALAFLTAAALFLAQIRDPRSP
jgi:hypothetical protein